VTNPHSFARALCIITLLTTLACGAAEDDDALVSLAQALTFHASFDNGPDADFALGDGTLYTAASYDEQDDAAAGIGSPEIEIVEGSGRFGNALEFKSKNTLAVFYRAEDNVVFSEADWSGTVSFSGSISRARTRGSSASASSAIWQSGILITFPRATIPSFSSG
jgi:hypothetical protein